MMGKEASTDPDSKKQAKRERKRKTRAAKAISGNQQRKAKYEYLKCYSKL